VDFQTFNCYEILERSSGP